MYAKRGKTCPMLQAKLPLNCLQICADLTQKVYIIDMMRWFFTVKAVAACLTTFSLFILVPMACHEYLWVLLGHDEITTVHLG